MSELSDYMRDPVSAAACQLERELGGRPRGHAGEPPEGCEGHAVPGQVSTRAAQCVILVQAEMAVAGGAGWRGQHHFHSTYR